MASLQVEAVLCPSVPRVVTAPEVGVRLQGEQNGIPIGVLVVALMESGLKSRFNRAHTTFEDSFPSAVAHSRVSDEIEHRDRCPRIEKSALLEPGL